MSNFGAFAARQLWAPVEPHQTPEIVGLLTGVIWKHQLGERGFSLIMRDTKNNNLAGSAFSVDRILDFLEERDIRRHVLIFDCCRAGRVLMSPRVRNVIAK